VGIISVVRGWSEVWRVLVQVGVVTLTGGEGVGLSAGKGSFGSSVFLALAAEEFGCFDHCVECTFDASGEAGTKVGAATGECGGTAHGGDDYFRK
jgi:hypothetical protein